LGAKLKNLYAFAAAVAAVSTPAMAQITPGDHTVTDVSSPLPVPGTWGSLPGENTNGGSATINSTNVTDTDGSLNVTGDRTRVQTGIQYSGGTNTGILANSIVSLTADYIVNTLGSNLSATPAFRVLIQDGSQRSELIWEGSVQADNQIGLGANSADAGDLFYQFVAGCGATFVVPSCGGSGTYVTNTLAGWGDLYSANAFVSGISIGVGSGAGSGFNANVDNLAFTTDGGTARYNFATANTAAVPEPATWAMMLIGFGGVGFQMRRTRRKSGLLAQAA
jgi:PEP-CTERM motif